ncbi:MAG: TIGR00730 family Rossman fold protein [Pseudomonadales bacterium]
MKRICVYCGSSPGRHPAFLSNAGVLAKEFVEQGIGLVYGGASVGIMGKIADEVIKAGGEVIGVIPQALVDYEVSHDGLSELKIVSSMHERKALMAELSDGFIALPGGLGTLEELFEVWTWSQLGFHNKPIALLNTENYYKHLLAFLNNAVDQSFVKDIHRDMLLVSDNPADLLGMMASYQPPKMDKWIGKEET